MTTVTSFAQSSLDFLPLFESVSCSIATSSFDKENNNYQNCYRLLPEHLNSNYCLYLPDHDDQCYPIKENKREYRNKDDYSIFGTFQNQEFSSLIFVVKNQRILGTITFNHEKYHISPVEQTLHTITSIDTTITLKESENYINHPFSIEDNQKKIVASTTKTTTTVYTENDRPKIKVLVILTLAAKKDFSDDGLSIETIVQLAQDSVNSAFENSNIIPRIEATYVDLHDISEDMLTTTMIDSSGDPIFLQLDNQSSAFELLEESEEILGSLENDLERLQNFTALNNFRIANNFDIVSLWASYPLVEETCGIANVITDFTTTDVSGNAYHILNSLRQNGVDCIIDNLSFAHQIGHNMGLQHDTYSTPEDGIYKYSHGYINPEARWRTIMTTDDYCNEVYGISCLRINYFSNKDIAYTDGNCLGNFKTDAQMSINKTAIYVDAFGGKASSTEIYQFFEKEQEELPIFSCYAKEGDGDNKYCLFTAMAQGTPLIKYKPQIRSWRDSYLTPYPFGKRIIDFYYQKLGKIAIKIKQYPILKQILSFALYLILYPFLEPINFICLLLIIFSFLIYRKYYCNM